MKVIVQPSCLQAARNNDVSHGAAVHSMVAGDLISFESEIADTKMESAEAISEVPDKVPIFSTTEPVSVAATSAPTTTFGHTAVRARVVKGARFCSARSAHRAGSMPSFNQTKQRRRMGARLRAVSARYEMPPKSFDASRVRFQIQKLGQQAGTSYAVMPRSLVGTFYSWREERAREITCNNCAVLTKKTFTK